MPVLNFFRSLHLLLITAKNIIRPQFNFKIPVDNSADKPFIPKIKYKPNLLKPLAVLPEYDEFGNVISYLHPYEFELAKFEPLNKFMKKSSTLTLPKLMEETSFLYVDDEKNLKQLLEDLKNYNEIAVDLEHHSYRTFQGITCLMQISTKDKDYVIDTIKLRDELHALNEFFTNPKILKIFHGADYDIIWLQRDLSLYIVNMFDTHQAAKLLGYPRLSLEYLLNHFCNREANKTFQLADWRIRPVPDELLSYARQDTHYLIYIYERIINELLEKGNGQLNLVKTVFKKSSEICQKRYIKPTIYPDSFMDLYRKSKKIFDNRQIYALSNIFAWRDATARQEDESYGYVLPNHMMLQIAESLPREMQGILACCNPIPPLVRQNLHAIHQIILKAREQPLVKPIIVEPIANRITTTSVKDFNNKLNCQQDLSHEPEFRDDLPTLLQPSTNMELTSISAITLKVPKLTVFFKYSQTEKENKLIQIGKVQKIQFVSPYERYKAAIPLIEKEKLEEIERQKAADSSRILCPIKEEKNLVESNYDVKEEEEDIYSLPLKESLKRKRDASDQSKKSVVTKKTKPNEVNEDEKLKFNPNSKQVPDKMNNNKKFMFDINVKGANDEQKSNISNQSNNGRDVNKKFRNKNKLSNLGHNSKDFATTSFDYSKVDFSKFQGGAQSAKGKEMHSKFKAKGKNNKKHDKKFNKLLTFNNSKNKKK